MSRLKSDIERAVVSPAEADQEGGLSCVCRFPADFLGFAGHFPGYAIVPAIVQVMAAQHLAENHLAVGMHLKEVKNAKFFLQLRPETDITVQCRIQPRDNETRVEAKLTCEQGVAASFILVFSPERISA
jgi:3-hydroxyacyl-[acyl-carrier-protein] dehydratase